MRADHVTFALCCCVLAGCTESKGGEQPAPSPAPEPKVVAAAEPAKPAWPSAASSARFGGALVAAGEYSVEVAANATGAIDAAVTSRAGQAVAPGDVSDLKVTVPGEGGAEHEAALAWDAKRAVFHGMIAGDAQLVSGPFEVSFALGGKTHTGQLAFGAVLPRPQFGGRMIAVGRYSAEVVPRINDTIEVYLRDETNAAVVNAAGLDLSLRVQGPGGALHDLALGWDEARAQYVARLHAGAKLAPGSIEILARTGEIGAWGRVEFAALVAPPSLGGSMIAAGDYTVEVAPQVDGTIDAVVRNAAGATVEGGVELEARVQAGGKLKTVALQWDPALLRFRGKLDGKLKIEPGPIELALVAEGRLREGAIIAAAIMPKLAIDANADAKADVSARADLKAKAKADAALAARLKAEAAAAQRAEAKARADLAALKAKASGGAKLGIKVPKPSVSLKAGASGNADAKASGSTTANTAARGTGEAKQQAGVKLGGGLRLGGN